MLFFHLHTYVRNLWHELHTRSGRGCNIYYIQIPESHRFTALIAASISKCIRKSIKELLPGSPSESGNKGLDWKGYLRASIIETSAVLIN
jgi:hypothetical protein